MQAQGQMIHTCAMGFSLHDEGDQAGVDIVAYMCSTVQALLVLYFCSRVTRGI